MIRPNEWREGRTQLLAHRGGRAAKTSRFLRLALRGRHPGQPVKAFQGLVCGDAEPKRQLQTLLVQLGGARVLARFARYAPKLGERVGERVGYTQRVRLAPQGGQALFQQRPGAFEVPLRANRVRQGADVTAGAERAPELAGYG